jgi:uncharacterized membrane protein
MRLLRILSGHRRTFAGIAAGLVCLPLLPAHWTGTTRGLLAWDIGSLVFLLLVTALFLRADPRQMPDYAKAQEEGEWTLFWLVTAGTLISFVAILGEFSGLKDASGSSRALRVSLVGATLVLTWLVTQATFALRYAHEYYQRNDTGGVDGGLDFPKEDCPDYWDFFYFAAVLGMTFQVSDVEITARKLRRLATLHGMLGFGYNTVVVALTVNLAAGLL